MRITSELGFYQPQRRLDMLANNAANVETVGFKAQIEEATQAFEPLETEANAAQYSQGPGANPTAGGQGALGSALYFGKRSDFSQGPIVDTGNLWDLAIAGEGFFQVVDGDGKMLYTRSGSFRLDREGRLTDAAGRFLQLTDAQGQVQNPPPVFPSDATYIAVQENGTVTVVSQGQEWVMGRIPLAMFPNPNGLLQREGSLYQVTPESGAAVQGVAGTDAGNGNGSLGAIRSGALEQSNVNLAGTMLSLIQAQRAYQLEARMVKQNDEMWGQANAIRR